MSADAEVDRRRLYFAFPRSGIRSGGHIAQVKILRAMQQIARATLVTYEQREPDLLFLDDVLASEDPRESIFVVHWGPHVPGLLHRLREWNAVYHAHSTGYGFPVEPTVPILAASLHSQAYWGRHAPNSLIYYVPNIISDEFTKSDIDRDIDVLVQKRKSSAYLLESLVPQLEAHCSVHVIDSWVPDLAEVFKRSKVYLYDSGDHWAGRAVSEGFGLPPLESLACGCTVFSSVNDGLSDFLQPGFNCHKLRGYALEYDVARILDVLDHWTPPDGSDPAAEYREPLVVRRLRMILGELNRFFDYRERYGDSLTPIKEREPVTERWTSRRAMRRYVPGPIRHLRSVLDPTRRGRS